MRMNVFSRKPAQLFRLVAIVALFAGLLPACGTTNDIAATFRGNSQHTGAYASSVEAGTEWKYSAPSQLYASPVLAGGLVYQAGFDGIVHVIDQATGKQKWQFEASDAIYSSPAVTGGYVYFGTAGGMLYAVNIEKHIKAWDFLANGVIHSSPTVSGGKVYAGSGDGRLYAIDADSGEGLWAFRSLGPFYSSPVVAGGLVYIGSGDKHMYALDAETGEQKWAFPVDDWIFSSPAHDNGTLYFGSHDGHLYALDAKTGEQKWEFETSGIIESSPSVAGGNVYFGSSDGNLYALDAATGEERWIYDTGGEVYTSPAVFKNRIYFGSFNGRFYAADAQTGEIAWQVLTGGRIMPSPAVDSDGRVYFASEEGSLYAIASEGPQNASLFPASAASQVVFQPSEQAIPSPAQGSGDLPWWNDRVFYEVNVRTFADSDGDGTGDLQGLISKLGYLNDGDPATTTDLGVTGLLLLPVAEASSEHGYDVTDFKKVEQDYGTNDDFKALVAAAHEVGIQVVIDLTFNQTSSQHPWFIESSSPGSDWESWYLWETSAPAWNTGMEYPVWHSANGRYYYARFSELMPDLNLRNPDVTDAIYDAAGFWLNEIGVDGFRLNAANALIEDGRILDNTPETHAWLSGFYHFVRSNNPDALLVGDIPEIGPQVIPYIGSQVDMAFENDLAGAIIDSLLTGNSSLLQLAQARILRFYPSGQYAAYLTRFDQARIMTELNNDADAARAAATLLITNPGVPFIFYGDEAGQAGYAQTGVISDPMNWEAESTPLSEHYRALLALRSNYSSIRSGAFIPVQSDNLSVYSYIRQDRNSTLFVVVNMTNQPISNYRLFLDEGRLAPISRVRNLMGQGIPFVPEIDEDGRFEKYVPLPALAARGSYIFEFIH